MPVTASPHKHGGAGEGSAGWAGQRGGVSRARVGGDRGVRGEGLGGLGGKEMRVFHQNVCGP